ncbi:MFS transporter [Fusibacillus kribbianus]|uniref:MFS transporter n=1 Tax=Fusibacillus kribbianus TaxID=3044208 RepID=A0AAP4B7N7_9FIRM|nr:MFS transporter [Ruminococcus sp. YH-rum2234]MDI9241130.1 MFS transporter [Ruminococcus sp. YH-rum2234]
MMKRIRNSYGHTIYASYIGYITQAVVNNFAPLLFLTFAGSFSLSLEKITLITTANFLIQLCVDFLSAKFIDRIGYRVSIVAAHLFAAAGLVGLAVFPALFGNAYAGLLTAVVLYAVGGGIIEVLISPIVESCPTEKKEAAMSLLHSFYCWGHVLLVVVCTGFFRIFGIENWRVLACLWAVIPLVNAFYFLFVPIYPVTGEHEKMSFGSLFREKLFWLFIVVMVCAGASEQAMSQWVSAFAESALHVSKTVGDLAGPCAFAVLMGTARALYGKFSEKIPLRSFMAGSAVLCIGCYVLASCTKNPMVGLLGCALCGFSVGIFWPGTFSMASAALPGGGTAMFAFMALAGDLGCSSGPTLVGMVAEAAGGDLKTGLLAAVGFPILILCGIFLLGKYRRREITDHAA